MKNFMNHMVIFLKKEDGPTAVEYAVLLALIIVACIATISSLGQNANSTFDKVSTEMQKANNSAGS